jgi:hypothetical protein
MQETLLKIAARCDGLRCDMAMLILPDIHERIWGARLGPNPIRESFWPEVIETVMRRHPHFRLLSEAYWGTEWRLQQEGFHFTYDKTLYDRLRSDDHDGVRAHLQADPSFQGRCLRFVENHDEERAVTAFGPLGAGSAAAVSFFAPGLKLVQEGQIQGRRIRVPVQLGRRPTEAVDHGMSRFYDAVFGFLKDPIFQSGVFSQLEVRRAGPDDTTNRSILALAWTPADRRQTWRPGCVIVVNRDAGTAYARIPFQLPRVFADAKYSLHDHLDGTLYYRSGSELRHPGLFVAMGGHHVHLFEIQSRSSY